MRTDGRTFQYGGGSSLDVRHIDGESVEEDLLGPGRDEESGVDEMRGGRDEESGVDKMRGGRDEERHTRRRRKERRLCD